MYGGKIGREPKRQVVQSVKDVIANFFVNS
jgi:hypothetical protein